MSMVLDAKIPHGPLADKWDEFKAHEKLVNPANKRKFKIIVVGTGLAGCLGSGHARRARLPGRRVHVPRLAAACALDRGPGRHQRREELQGRRRLGVPAVLRHHQGRRLPRP
jgi:hypothetical protein